MKYIKCFSLIALFAFLFAGCNFDSPSESVEYTVSHYQQNVQGDEYTLFETETFTGMTGESAVVTAKAYEGFTVQNVNSVTISKNLDVAVKYDRNTITYTLNYNGGTVKNSDGTESDSSVVSGRYGSAVVFPEPEKEGYILDCWYDSDGKECDGFFYQSGTYTAYFVLKTKATYKVHHLFQNIENDDYTEDKTLAEVFEGNTGSNTKVKALEKLGFTAKEITQQKICADGSTEINVYYDRNLVTYTFNLAGGKGVNSISQKYGTTVTAQIVSNPQKDGAVFSGWNPALPESFTEDKTFTAVYDMPFYTVKYLFENISDSDYSANENYPDEIYLGSVGTYTNVVSKNIPGFVAQNVDQKIITQNNSTVIEVKYNRKLITLYIDIGSATGTNYIQAKYGADKMTVAAKLKALMASENKPCKIGFTLNHFEYDENLSFTLENDELTAITAKWTGGSEAWYTVAVYLEKLTYTENDEKYEFVENKFIKGKAGEQITFSTAEYTITFGDSFADSDSSKDFNYSGFEPVVSKIENLEIAGNDTTVVKLYFDRRKISYTFKLNGGNIGGKEDDFILSGRFGEKIPMNQLPVPVKTGYSYEWKKADETYNFDTFDSENQEISADWTAKEYSVIFHNGDAQKSCTVTYNTVIASNIFTEANHTFAGWSVNSDGSTVDYKTGESFLLSYEDSLVTEHNLYALWNTSYIANYYKENSDGVFEKQSEDVTVIYPTEKIVSVAAKQFDGLYQYVIKPVEISFDNSTTVNFFFTKNPVLETAETQIVKPEFNKNSGKHGWNTKIYITNVENGITYLSSTDNGETFKVMDTSEEIVLQAAYSLAVVGIKNGMQTSEIQSAVYEAPYIGENTPAEPEVFAICYSDKSSTPASVYNAEGFAFTDSQKNAISDIIFYVGESDDDALGKGAVGLNISLNSYTTGRMHQESTSTYMSGTAAEILLQDYKDGSAIWQLVQKAAKNSSTDKDYYYYAFTHVSSLEGGYYLPTYTEIKKLFEKIETVNAIMTKLGKTEVDLDKYYLTTLISEHKANNSTQKNYYSKVVSPKNGDTDVFGTKYYTVLPIRRIK